MKNKRNRYTSRYNLGGKRMYQAGGRKKRMYQGGGMYGTNVIPPGIGATTMQMYQESDPKLQEEREKALLAEQEKLTQEAAAMKQGIEEEKQLDQQKIAAASEDKIGAGVDAARQALQMGLESGVIPTKEAAKDPTQAVGAVSAYRGTRAANLGLKATAGNAPGMNLLTNPAAAEKALKALPKGARIMSDANTGKTIVVDAAGNIVKQGSAIGAGLKSFVTSGAGLGTIASLAGAGLKKWTSDDDATTMNFGEGAGATLSGIGTGLGTAALAGMAMGSAVPLVGNIIGAGVGAAYGLGKALVQRNKARAEEARLAKEKQGKIDEFSAELGKNLAMHKAQVRAGNLRQKTYSGYDLGRNVVAQMGGMRMGMPRYGY